MKMNPMFRFFFDRDVALLALAGSFVPDSIYNR
jgi:hypothetical protein